MDQYTCVYANEAWTREAAKAEAQELRRSGTFDRVLVSGLEVKAYKITRSVIEARP